MRKRTILWRQNLKYWVIIIAATILAGMLLNWVINLDDTYSAASARFTQAEKKQQELIERKKDLEERNNLLHTTTGKRDFLVTREAMISQGERVLVLVEDDRNTLTNTKVEEVVKTPWWQW